MLQHRNSYEGRRSEASKMLKAETSELWRKSNPEKSRAIRRRAAKRWREQNPDASRKADRAKRLKKQYGLTVDQWDKMFKAQGQRCACCGTDKSSPFWHTDHKHGTTGQVRSILCQRCNTSLGIIENQMLLSQCLAYLEKHHASA